MPAVEGGVASARVQVRAKKLLQLCFNALTANSNTADVQGQAQRFAGPAAAVWHRLLDLVIKLTGAVWLSLLLGHQISLTHNLCILACIHAVCIMLHCSARMVISCHSVVCLFQHYSMTSVAAMNKHLSLHYP